MAFQSGPKSPSAISRRGRGSDRKSIPGWQVADNIIISNLVQKTANKSWVQINNNVDRNARTQSDFFAQVSLPFFNFKIVMQQNGHHLLS